MGHGKYEKRPEHKKAAPPVKREAEGAGKKPKAGKKKVLFRVMIVVLSILLALMIFAAVALNYVLGRLGRPEDTQPYDTIPEEQHFETDENLDGRETVDPTDVEFEEVDILNNKEIVNILLIGNDSRTTTERGRSDTIILASLNRKTDRIQLTSFMRDLYVQIPGYLDNRINAAFRFGGPELLDATLEKNFGIQVDGNVEIDFEEFVNVIELLGGIDVEMNQEESNHLNSTYGYSTVPGMNHLNGEVALMFSRIRNLSGGDYGRTERQRRVITSVLNSLKDASLPTVLNLVDQVLPHVITDMTNKQIIDYATVGLSVLAKGGEITSLRIPADDAHYGAMINEMSVLVPDLKMCQEDLAEFIYAEE